ncbi:MAG: DUF4270 family protein [Rikenellaceae bacterium]
MNRFKLMRRLLGGMIVIATVAVITFSGCTNIDYTLGSNLTIENQSLKLGQLNIDGTTGDFFQSRLYQTDSITTSCLSYGYFGIMGNDTFGTRSAGFYSQYIPANILDDDIFGYMPIFDSAVLYLSVEAYGGDTTVSQEFEVFEIIDDSFLTESADSIFFPDMDMTPYIAKEPVFTFTYPDYDNGVYVASTSVTMKETDLTYDFIDRLMLITETDEYDEEIYDEDEDWVDVFKGLYIRPTAALDPYQEGKTAAIYSTLMESSGWGFYGRNREETDPTLIQDTIGMTYVFYSSYAEAGNVSINFFDYNYDGSLIDFNDVKTPSKSDDEVPLTSVLRVEAMGGVVSEITLTEDFFYELDQILDTEYDGVMYESLFFNQAKLKIYMQEVTSHDPNDIDIFTVTPWMNVLPTNLALYTNYSHYYYDEDDVTYATLTGVSDYLYAYESSYTLDFGGELNRSWGCYVMNIPGHIQVVWNSYLAAKEEAEENGTDIDWDSVEYRKMYLGPTASNLFSSQYASLQASDPELNSAPFYLELTYTMIR